jgi:integrase
LGLSNAGSFIVMSEESELTPLIPRAALHGRADRAVYERTIPIGPDLVTTLREWKLACPNGDLGLAFPSVAGKIDPYSNIVHKFEQVVRAAGLLDRLGQPNYTGLHPLRHFYASWCINRKDDGGLELPAKIVACSTAYKV